MADEKARRRNSMPDVNKIVDEIEAGKTSKPKLQRCNTERFTPISFINKSKKEEEGLLAEATEFEGSDSEDSFELEDKYYSDNGNLTPEGERKVRRHERKKEEKKLKAERKKLRRRNFGGIFGNTARRAAFTKYLVEHMSSIQKVREIIPHLILDDRVSCQYLHPDRPGILTIQPGGYFRFYDYETEIMYLSSFKYCSEYQLQAQQSIKLSYITWSTRRINRIYLKKKTIQRITDELIRANAPKAMSPNIARLRGLGVGVGPGAVGTMRRTSSHDPRLNGGRGGARAGVGAGAANKR